MARCVTITFVLSGVVLAGLCYMLYTPLAPNLENGWQLQLLNARSKAAFLYAELSYQLGFSDRMSAIRFATSYVFRFSLTEEDKAMLEVYDTKLNGVSVRVYKPKSTKGPLPGLVYYHGGGWSLLDVPSYDGICAHIAWKANIIVISVEYRLAPEVPFPGGFDDCVKVALFAIQKGNEIGLDSKNIAVGGDSAGGNLAAAVSLKLRDDKVKPPLKAQVLIYGLFQMCDMTLPSFNIQRSYDANVQTLLAAYMRWYLNLTETQTKLLTGNNYLTPQLQSKCDRFVNYKLLPNNLIPEKHIRPDRQAATITDDVKLINSFLDDARVFPMMTDNLANLPSSFVLAVYWDLLRDENIIFAERLKLAGNNVRLLYLEDSFHGIINNFDYGRSGFEAGTKTMNEIISFLKAEFD